MHGFIGRVGRVKVCKPGIEAMDRSGASTKGLMRQEASISRDLPLHERCVQRCAGRCPKRAGKIYSVKAPRRHPN
jgi:hypothetical protein